MIKVLVCAYELTTNTNMSLGNQFVIQVSSFKYLSSLITADGST